MANDGFNGSTVSFAGATLGDLRGARYRTSGVDVDVTNAAGTSKLFVAGIPDQEVSVDIVGTPSVAHGATGALTVNWFDGSNDTVAAAYVTSFETSGSMDGEITSTITFKPLKT